MASSAVRKRARIRSIAALTANSVNGVLIRDAASVLIRGGTKENPIINPKHYINDEES
jgi:hypothetical protein